MPVQNHRLPPRLHVNAGPPPGHGLGRFFGRVQYWAKRVVFVSTGTSDLAAWTAIVISLCVSWAVAYGAGGTGIIAPHWFYLPIIFAAVRFGPIQVLMPSVVAGVLAGPLLPNSVRLGEAQRLLHWLSRAIAFVVIGQVVTLLVARSTGQLSEELVRLKMAEALRRGLARNEFRLVYQPVIDLDSGQMVGTEALLRWTPATGPMSPADFIPTAEESDVIHPIGAWVLERACEQGAKWVRSLAPGQRFTMGVNISACQLRDPHLGHTVQNALQRSGLPANALVLEITETALIDIEECAAALESLKRLGVRLAIDDFGTGQSSLSYVHRLPVDVIKIDRSFVSEIATKTVSVAVTAGIINLAHSMGNLALAEGIETAGQLALLRSMGCDLGQGYYLGRPESVEVVSEQVARIGTTESRR